MKAPEGCVPEGYNWQGGAPAPCKAAPLLAPPRILSVGHVLYVPLPFAESPYAVEQWAPEGADAPTPPRSVASPLPCSSGAGLGAGVGAIRDSVLMTGSRANATR
jgi:hypothetical protein